MKSIGNQIRGGVLTSLSCLGLSLCLGFVGTSGAAEAPLSGAGPTLESGMVRVDAIAPGAGPMRIADAGDLFVVSTTGRAIPLDDDHEVHHVVTSIAEPTAPAIKAGTVDVGAASQAAAPMQVAKVVGDGTAAASGDPTPSEVIESGTAMTEEDLPTTPKPAAESFVDAVRSDAVNTAAATHVEVAPAQVAQATADPTFPAADPAYMEDTPRLPENPAAASTFEKTGTKDGIMRVLAGKSLIVNLRRPAKRVSVANPEVAEVLVISPRQVMINGLANGETSVIVWDAEGNYTMNTLVVGDQLQDQVMLEVTVAEINRTQAEKHGVDVRAMGGQFGTVTQFGNATPTSGSYPPGQGDPLFPFGLDGGISWAVIDFKNDIAVFFKQLQEENLGRVLAEPKLLARSGKEANFLSGGEIPIVITQQQNTTIEFKEFGTKIKFVPEVREDGTIDLKVQSEVSEPDYANGVKLFGFQVPAFVTRRVDTDVTLRTSESLVVAGLIKETKRELESKLPFAGDIPLLGDFFRSTEFSKEVTELVMVVKPKIVAPVAAGQTIPLPTDRGPLTRKEVRTKPEAEKVSRPRPY